MSDPSIAKTCTIGDPSVENVEVYRGATFQLDYTCKDEDGTAVSIASAKIFFTVWDIEAGANQFQYLVQPVTAGTWTSNVVTFTATAHGYEVGDIVIVEDCGNTNYNGTHTVTAETDDTFSAALGSDPGAFTTAGYVSKSDGRITMTTPASGTFSVLLSETQTDTDCKVYRYSIRIEFSGGSDYHAAVGLFRILDGVYDG